MTKVEPAGMLHRGRGHRPSASHVQTGIATDDDRRRSEDLRLHGRSSELDAIRRFLADTATGTSQLLVIEGPRGIGKSRLLSEAVALGRLAGFVVWAGSSAAQPPSSFADTRRPHHRTRPLLIAADDPAEAQLFAPSTTPSTAEAVAFASHPAGAADEVVNLRQEDDRKVLRLNLNSLDVSSAARMIEDILGATPDRNLLAYVGSAGGNPRLVVDLVTGLAKEHLILIHEGRARLCRRSLPAQVVHTVRSWLFERSAKLRQLLRVGSVLGATFDLSEALDLLHETTVSMLPVLDEALSAALLICQDDRFVFANALLQQAIRESLPAPAQVAMEQDVQRMRARRPDPWGDRAAGEPGVGRVLTTEHDRTMHEVEAIRSLVAAGRLEAAICMGRSTLRRPLPQELAIELRCLLSDVLVMAGHAAQGVVEAERALTVSTLQSARTRITAKAALMFGLYLLDSPAARTRAEAMLRRAGMAGTDPDAVWAAMVLSCIEWKQGNLSEGLRWGREAAAGVDGGSLNPWPKLALATKLGDLRQFDDAEAMISDAADHIGRLKLAAHSSAVMTVRARLRVQEGRLAEAHDEALGATDIATELETPLFVPLARTVMALVALRSGDPAAAAAHVHRYRVELKSGKTFLQSPQYDWVELLVTYAQFGPERAIARLTDEFRGLESNRALLVQEPEASAFFAQLAIAFDDQELAGRAVAVAELLARDNPELMHTATSARHARAVLNRNREELANAVDVHKDPWARDYAETDLTEFVSGAPHVPPPVPNEPVTDGAEPPIDAKAAEIDNSGWRELTETQRAIAELVGSGLTNRQVAKRMYLSPHTVNYHLRAIFRTVGVSTRVELVHHRYRSTNQARKA